MKWFRFYSEVWHDPKVQRLPAPLFKAWVMALCLASEGQPRGRLPATERDTAYGLHLNEAQARRAIAELRDRGLLDQIEGRLVPHNWDERQPFSDNAAERMRRTRSEHVPNSSEQPPNKFVPEAEVDTDTEADREEEKQQQQQPGIFKLYESTIGTITLTIRDRLLEAEKEYPDEWVRWAFEEAERQNVRKWAYVDAILKRYRDEGVGPRLVETEGDVDDDWDDEREKELQKQIAAARKQADRMVSQAVSRGAS